MKERTILHVDANNFFASVECIGKDEWKKLPVAVTGNPNKRNGIILAKNEVAKKLGIKTGEAIWQAKQKAPNLITLPPHYDKYEKISKRLHEIYLDYTDLVEPLGLDECFMDVTESLNYLLKDGKEIADEIRQRVKEEISITVSAGVSFSKIYAKLGSDLKKPDATTIISRDNFKEIAFPLPLNSIIGIGSRLENKFTKMNVLTIGDFVKLDDDILKIIIGKNGIELKNKLLGVLVEPVANYFHLAPPKSIGNGTTTIIDIQKRNEVKKVVAYLCEKVSIRLKNGNYQAKNIAVTIKTAEFEKFRHSKKIEPVQSFQKVFESAMELIDSFWQYDKKIRAIRVRVYSLSKIDEYMQLSLFQDDKVKILESVEYINKKYGKNKIHIASDGFSFINQKNEEEELD